VADLEDHRVDSHCAVVANVRGDFVGQPSTRPRYAEVILRPSTNQV
jgi:hypothetical protein